MGAVRAPASLLLVVMNGAFRIRNAPEDGF